MSTILPESFLNKMDADTRKSLGKPGRTIADVAAVEEARTEKAIHLQIIQELNRREIPFLRARMDKKSTLPEGWPDFSVFLPFLASRERDALVWFVEVKTATGKLSAEQKSTLARLNESGFHVSVPRSFEEFVAELRRITTDQPIPAN